jgi:soluble lytic murein transglycosylase
MKTLVKNISLALSFLGAINACASETALDLTKKEAAARVQRGDTGFITAADPSRMAELSKIDATLPFYAALLIEEQDADKERTANLLREALNSPAAREAAAQKLAALETDGADGPRNGAAAEDGVTAGRAAVERRDYNAAARLFRAALDEDEDVFLADNELLGDLSRAFLYSAAANADEGAKLFLAWEKEIREGGRLWALPAGDRNRKRYLLVYYAARMTRRARPAQIGEAEVLFDSALALAPDREQADACIWYILDIALAKNGKTPEKMTGLVQKYAQLWHDPAYFFDFFEKFTHLLCLNRRWDEIAELFPSVRVYGGPETRAKYAFILGNAVELNFLTAEKAAMALGLRESSPFYPLLPRPEDFYQIACDSDVITGADTTSFYYIAAAARKLGKKPRINMSGHSDGEADGGGTPDSTPDARSGSELVTEFLSGFFTFGAARFAYPYIMASASGLSVPELRSFAKSLAGAERWGESIRLARTYMRRPDYSPNPDDLRICYPLAYSALVAEVSGKTGMDRETLYGLIRTESLFMPDVVSSAGAVGLTQLMPETARETARRLERNGGPDYFTDGALDLADPALNIHLGALYFERLKDGLESPLLALLSYNGGVNRVRRWRASRPALNEALFLESVDYAETRDYGRQTLAAAEIYRCLSSL